MNWPGSCGRIETPCRTRQGAQEVPDIMLSFYLSALESAADKEDFRALYRRYHGVMERTLWPFCKTRAMRRRPCRRLLSG